MELHINIEDLLSARTVESDRIEYKEGWNPDAIYRSICGFANDFDNTGGGYILIGIEEENGIAKRPVKGLSTVELAEIQRKMIGFNNLLQPTYHAKLFIEIVDSKQIVVLWIPGGSNRPYQVPENITATQKRYFYYIRKYANSVKANLEEQQELIALANQIPFDDRVNTLAQVNNISMLLVKDHLTKIKSRLAEEVGKRSDSEILEQMGLLSGPNEHVFPRNVGLMMFSENPSIFFPNTEVDLVYFPHGEASPYTEYPKITGPIPEQIRRTLDFLKTNILEERVIKPTDQAESIRTWNYPLQAIEETLVNAFYHRDYQMREPIEIRIYPHSVIFINHGGPDRSIQLQAFQTGQVRARRYRNRRLGDFLKELDLTEGRATGIPTIFKVLKDNGSPLPRFNTDEDRTFFEVELFIHPSFQEAQVSPEVIEDEGSAVAISEELIAIDDKVKHIISISPERIGSKVRDVAGDIVGDKARKEFKNRIGKNDESIAGDIVGAIDRDTVVDVAIDAQEFIKEKMEKILLFCRKPKQRKEILQEIGLVNNVKNYNAYVSPLIILGWITMTIPDKPTSPNQQYRTTLKGRIITELMNYIDSGE